MKIFLVVNPTKVDDPEALRAKVGERCRSLGLEEPELSPSTKEDPGEGMARDAVASGAGLVLSAGGDGTVMSVSRGLSGTSVPLGVLPVGTGNLLARNLDLPLDLDEAVEVVLTGGTRTIDLGQVCRDGGRPEGFAVMAGAGFDAAMMADAPDRLKGVVGWAAYLASGVQHLRDRPVRVDLCIDDGPVLTRRARSVIVGNVGTLQGGLALMPDARPDDGLLHVVLLSPRGLTDWARVLLHLAERDPDQGIERFRGTRIEVRAERSQPGQLDGDPVGDVRHLVLEVRPGALQVKVPPRAG